MHVMHRSLRLFIAQSRLVAAFRALRQSLSASHHPFFHINRSPRSQDTNAFATDSNPFSRQYNMPAAGKVGGKAMRKTHQKSRMGCAFCKRRRIKVGVTFDGSLWVISLFVLAHV